MILVKAVLFGILHYIPAKYSSAVVGTFVKLAPFPETEGQVLPEERASTSFCCFLSKTA
jgi:hypothetical protein